ncbi:MAG: YecA family protein, partial [Nitrospira sp. LK265]|nr:YecA family protein [Nitrospira sp. LK265]
REEIIAHMAAGLLQIYRYYLSQRQSSIPRPVSRTVRRETAKVGRNDPCPCGSGKKYKHCHGGTTLH